MYDSDDGYFEDSFDNSREEYSEDIFAELGPAKTSWRIRTSKRFERFTLL